MNLGLDKHSAQFFRESALLMLSPDFQLGCCDRRCSVLLQIGKKEMAGATWELLLYVTYVLSIL